jgi:hypothetical protein
LSAGIGFSLVGVVVEGGDDLVQVGGDLLVHLDELG